MGNCSCIDRSAVVSWADDVDWEDWEWTAAGAGSSGRPANKPKQQKKNKKGQQLKERLLHGSTDRAEDLHHHKPEPPVAAATLAATAADTGTHEVKIKISKRQLEELLRKDVGGAGGGGEDLRRALEGLLGSRGLDWEQVVREFNKVDDAGGHQHDHHLHHHWKPNLQSIPECDGAEL